MLIAKMTTITIQSNLIALRQITQSNLTALRQITQSNLTKFLTLMIFLYHHPTIVWITTNGSLMTMVGIYTDLDTMTMTRMLSLLRMGGWMIMITRMIVTAIIITSTTRMLLPLQKSTTTITTTTLTYG